MFLLFILLFPRVCFCSLINCSLVRATVPLLRLCELGIVIFDENIMVLIKLSCQTAVVKANTVMRFNHVQARQR